ncbi:MAG: membrane protein insertase YidC [Bacteroidales bacterium]|jgi:YidC/Oxa1 family membrane protein insertase|nr:membrane protein insertase YidC [Bacteroidales bacterium]
MDRNSIIGIVLIAAVLIVYSVINQPSKDEIERAKQRKDSLELVRQQNVAKQQKAQQALEQTTEPKAPKKDTTQREQLVKKYGSFASAAEGEKEFAVVENDLMKIEFSNKGGRIYSVELKDYKTYTQEPLILFDGDSTVFGLNFFSQNKSIITNDLFFTLENEEHHYVVENDAQSISYRLYAGDDQYIEYVYTVYPGTYKLDFNINFVGINEVIASNLSMIDLKWSMYSPQQEKGAENENMYTTIGYKYYQDDVNTLTSRSKEENNEELNTRVKWISFQQQFFSSILVADDFFTNAVVEFNDLPNSNKYLKHFRSTIGIPFNYERESTVPLQFYFGPNHYTTLKKHGLEFERIIPLGWGIFGWVNRFVVIPVFNFLDNFIANYGLIILILTILIKVVLFPLTYKSYLSTAKMRVLKPEIDQINKKFPKKEDAMKKQQATMALYKKAGVNPMGGCIPMLIQFPILIALFRFFPSSIELRQKSFLWADDLSSYDSILDLPFDIPFYGDHVSLFTLLMALALFLSTKINSGQMGDANQQMPGMKFMMNYMMPIMLLFFFNGYSSGLSYYYFLSNVITMGQTLIIRRFVDDETLLKKLHENKKKPVKKSKWQQRLEEAAKQKGYKPPKR